MLTQSYPQTDKVALGYVPVYEALAVELGRAARVCEIGVWRGESLRLWQSLFPAGLVVGVDIDHLADWPAGTHQVVASQTDPMLPGRLRTFSPAYDLIVEDASHDGEASAETFRLLWPLVAPDGCYVLEDWMVGFESWSGPGPWRPAMLETARSFLDLLEHPGGEVASITYRYGMVVIRKARA